MPRPSSPSARSTARTPSLDPTDRLSHDDEKGDLLDRQQTLDRDLAHLADGPLRPPVTPPRRRLPDEIALIYRGRRSGILHDEQIDIVVPDEDNATKVAQIQAVVPSLDEQTRRREHKKFLKEWNDLMKETGDEGDKTPPAPYQPLRQSLAMSGPSYHFKRNETTLVHREDAPYLLAHETFRLEKAT